jgi:hypothetical protein
MKACLWKHALLASVIAFSGIAAGCDEEKDSKSSLVLLAAMQRVTMSGNISKGGFDLGACENYGTLIISTRTSWNGALSDNVGIYTLPWAERSLPLNYSVDITGVPAGSYYVYFVIYLDSAHESGYAGCSDYGVTTAEYSRSEAIVIGEPSKGMSANVPIDGKTSLTGVDVTLTMTFVPI